jgi:mycothiol synthase
VTVPAGHAVRRGSPSAVADATGVARALELAELSKPETTAADLADDWRELDPARDVWLVDEGLTVAYGAAYPEGPDLVVADAYVVPRARGRGLGAFLVRSTEARAAERGARTVHNGVLVTDGAARELLEQEGYAAVRRFSRMTIELTEPPDPVGSPAGVVLRTFRLGEDDEAFHAASEAAFADHWGFVPEQFEEWRTRAIASPRFDPGLWFVAEERRTIVGLARCTWKEKDVGWVNDLAVVPAARKRGIATALLTQAFAEFHRRGERRIGLGVDTRNETGATRLYERAGMQATYVDVIYEKIIR